MSETRMLRSASDSDRQRALGHLAAECVRRLAAGEAMDEQALVQSHPELMPELVDQLRQVRMIDAARRGVEHVPQKSRLRVRCPHCHMPTDVDNDSTLRDVTCQHCGSRFGLVDDRADETGLSSLTELGHFLLLERVGAGAFGVVWKAMDRELGRTVAIKVPRRGELNSAQAEQFLREARLAAQLRHPHIVSVHELGIERQTLYIVSDFIEGVSLADRLAGQRLNGRESAQLAQHVAHALAHAHDLGVVHRDVKPSNILLDEHGQPHLTDFGLASRKAVEATVTLSGQLVGTPAYMSPEQARGDSHAVDQRSDIYGLGVVLFEMLTGELPFRGTPRIVLQKIQDTEPPDLRSLNSAVPLDLNTICLKCLNKEPAQRYTTAQELADDLGRFLRGEPIHARPVGRCERAWRWCRRKPLVAGLTAAVALLLLAVTAGAIATAWRETLHRRAAEAQALQALRQQYLADMQLAMQAWTDGRQPHAVELLHRYRAQSDLADFRGFEWYCLWKQCEQGVRTRTLWSEHDLVSPGLAFLPSGQTLVTSGGEVKFATFWDLSSGRVRMEVGEHDRVLGNLAVSPDGTLLATGGQDNYVKLLNTATGQLVRSLGTHPLAVLAVAFSADGQTLVSASTDNVKIWDVATGGMRHDIHPTKHLFGSSLGCAPHRDLLAVGQMDGSIECYSMESGLVLKRFDAGSVVLDLDFSPDGEILATAHRDMTIRLWDLQRGAVIRTLSAHTNSVATIDFSADGELLASGDRGGLVLVWDLQQGRVVNSLRGHSGHIVDVAFSPIPGERTLASRADDRSIKIWDVAASREPSLIDDAGSYTSGNSIAVSPDGRTLAVGCEAGELRLIDPTTGRRRAAVRGNPERVWAVAISPDSRLVATGGGKNAAQGDFSLRLFDSQTGELVRTLAGHEGPVRCLDFSTDGVTLASAGDDKTVRLWNVATGDPLRTFPGPEGQGFVWAVAIASDNRRLAMGDLWGTASLIDMETGETLQQMMGPLWLRDLDFSPDGRLLACAADRGVVTVWDTLTGRQRWLLRGDVGRSDSVTFSPDGKSLASTGHNRAVHLWDVATGETRLVFPAKSGWVEFSSDSRTLYVSEFPSAIRVWRTASPQEVGELTYAATGYSDASRAADRQWLSDRLLQDGVARWVCGGEREYVDQQGRVWGTDRFFTPGSYAARDDEQRWRKVVGTSDPLLYNTGRWFAPGATSGPAYLVPVPSGRYRVTLHFAEWFAERGVRFFDVTIEGVKVLDNFEPGAKGVGVAQQESFETMVEDDLLEIEFGHRQENPHVMAIEVYRH